MSEFKELLKARTREAEEIIRKYLPEEKAISG